jgi:hypothetical protein
MDRLPLCVSYVRYSDLQSALRTGRLRLERRYNAPRASSRIAVSLTACATLIRHIQVLIIDSSIEVANRRGGCVRPTGEGNRDSRQDCLDSGDLTKID